MSPRYWKERVQDILEAIEEIQSFVQGLSFDQFKGDGKTVKAVLADSTIIGEAARHIPDRIASQHADIPWRLMRDMRNTIVHIYFGVEPATVWKTIRDDLPPLVSSLHALLAVEQGDDG